MKNLINRLFTFANTLCSLFTVKSNVRDGRKSPQIKLHAIFLSPMLMVLLMNYLKAIYMKASELGKIDLCGRKLNG